MTARIETLMMSALANRHTTYTTYDIARAAILRGVPGDFVECGVYAGAQAAAMAKAIMDEPPDHIHRRVHLLDSFRGIPAAGPHDREFLEAGHLEGLSACSIESVGTNMTNWGIDPHLLTWHEGLFADTVPILASQMRERCRHIAILRLDGDLYESTKVCLEHLYPLLAPGGWCIVDDWNLAGCRKAVLEIVGTDVQPVCWQKA